VKAILLEAHRVLKLGGLTYHHIGLHDHSANSDSSISVLNLVRFGDTTWKILGQNKIQYRTRLRASDLESLFVDCGFTIVFVDRKTAPLYDLRAAPRFAAYRPEDLASTVSRRVPARPQLPENPTV